MHLGNLCLFQTHGGVREICTCILHGGTVQPCLIKFIAYVIMMMDVPACVLQRIVSHLAYHSTQPRMPVSRRQMAVDNIHKFGKVALYINSARAVEFTKIKYGVGKQRK